MCATDKDDRISQRGGVGFDARPEVWAEATRQYEIDLAMQQGFEFLGQGEVVAEAAFVCQVDQQIDIAVRAFLAAGHRAEQAEIRRAMPRGDLVQRVTAAAEVIA
jgi:hypothetical protein